MGVKGAVITFRQTEGNKDTGRLEEACIGNRWIERFEHLAPQDYGMGWRRSISGGVRPRAFRHFCAFRVHGCESSRSEGGRR